MKLSTVGLTITLLVAVPMIGLSQSLDMATAEKQFAKYCAKCHGTQGRGDGDQGAALKQPPKDFTNCAEMAKEPDDRLFNAIKNGGEPFEGQKSDMPAMGRSLSDDEIHALVAHTRRFCLQGGRSVAQVPSAERGKQSP